MKTDRVIWGIILLFIGGVLLLENFNIIDFYWRNVWRFWPMFLIIAGVNILFSKNKSQLGGIISIGVLVVTLGLLFVKGQQTPEHRSDWFGDRIRDGIREDLGEDFDRSSDFETLKFSTPYSDPSIKKAVLNISGGGTSFGLKGETDSLVTAEVQKRTGNFSLKSESKDSLTNVTFKMNGKSSWSVGDNGNTVDFKLNKALEWDIVMELGAGEVNFDLSAYKVRKFRFDGGAAAVDVKVGDLLPISDIVVKTGVATVKLNVPTASGCRIKTKTGLSAKDFTGFVKISEGIYETSNYNSAAKKIFINLDGGLSNFEVKRY